MLHLDTKSTPIAVKSANVANIEESESAVTPVNSLTVNSDSAVLLATALIGVFGKNGNRVMLRALLDQGSQCAFITENAAQTLSLPRQKIEANIAGIGGKTQTAKWSVNLTIFPRFESSFSMATNAIVLSKLTRTARGEFNVSNLDFLHNLTLADPSFRGESEIDMILGAAEYARVLRSGLMKPNKNMIAQNTDLG